MALSSKDLLGIKGMSADENTHVLDTAASFKDVSERDIKKVPTLRGKTVINLFYEASTRTRTSFELAGKRLSADVIIISTSDDRHQIRRSISRERQDRLVHYHDNHFSSGGLACLVRPRSQPSIHRQAWHSSFPAEPIR